MKEKILKIVKIALIVIALACFVGLVFHFVRGIQLSLHDNDTKTAQNRINSAYAFLMMLAAGLCTILSLIGVFSIKVRALPKCIGEFFGLKFEEKEQEEQQEITQEEVKEEI